LNGVPFNMPVSHTKPDQKLAHVFFELEGGEQEQISPDDLVAGF